MITLGFEPKALANVMLVVPNVMVPTVLQTYVSPAPVLPDVTKKASPWPSALGLISPYVSVSDERVSTQAVEPSPTVVTVYTPF